VQGEIFGLVKRPRRVRRARATLIYPTATHAGALTPLPGGLGVTETLIQQQLVRLAGVGASAATASMLMVRLATLWWAVAVGFLALGVLKLRHPQLLGSKPDQGAISG
jgi:uncharacterized membrane protein YbhN (UPF0104 family)